MSTKTMARKNDKKPIYQVWWFWVIIVIIWFSGSITASLLFGTKPEQDSSSQSQPQAQEIVPEEKIKQYIEANYPLVIDAFNIDDGTKAITLALWTKSRDFSTRNAELKEACEPIAKTVLEAVPDIGSIHIHFMQKMLKGASRCVYNVDNGSLVLDAEYWDEESE